MVVQGLSDKLLEMESVVMARLDEEQGSHYYNGTGINEATVLEACRK